MTSELCIQSSLHNSFTDTMAQQTPPLSHYETLQISPAFVSAQKNPSLVLRHAYRRALLRHHPDKHQIPPPPTTITVDRITQAFNTLIDPSSKAVYDRSLLLANKLSSTPGPQRDEFQTGIEAVDLDDLEYHDEEGCWFRACRCGNERGFLLTEDDLDEASDHGEVVAGCAGCSLWIKVHFAEAEQ